MEPASLAQHYGRPTSLLDFTPELPAALYFAASGALQWLVEALEKGDEESVLKMEMDVWELDAEKAERAGAPIILYKPGAENWNAQTQDGHLVRLKKFPPYNGLLDLRPLDEQLASLGAENAIIRHSSRITEVYNLFCGLDSCGLTAEAFFPGPAGEIQHAVDLINKEKCERLMKLK